MTRYTNAINNQFLDIAVLGNLTKTLTAQVAVSPAIEPENSVVSGLLVNPVYSLSSGTLFGEQITPFFNPGAGNTYAASPYQSSKRTSFDVFEQFRNLIWRWQLALQLLWQGWRCFVGCYSNWLIAIF